MIRRIVFFTGILEVWNRYNYSAIGTSLTITPLEEEAAAVVVAEAVAGVVAADAVVAAAVIAALVTQLLTQLAV